VTQGDVPAVRRHVEGRRLQKIRRRDGGPSSRANTSADKSRLLAIGPPVVPLPDQEEQVASVGLLGRVVQHRRCPPRHLRLSRCRRSLCTHQTWARGRQRAGCLPRRLRAFRFKWEKVDFRPSARSAAMLLDRSIGQSTALFRKYDQVVELALELASEWNFYVLNYRRGCPSIPRLGPPGSTFGRSSLPVTLRLIHPPA
jgi:hypothetical protein